VALADSEKIHGKCESEQAVPVSLHLTKTALPLRQPAEQTDKENIQKCETEIFRVLYIAVFSYSIFIITGIFEKSINNFQGTRFNT
jgi:hypothetical protein